MLKSTPVPKFRERWRVLTEEGYTDAQIQDALDNVLFCFGRMEEELTKRGPWLAGKTFSLGDIGMLAIVHRTSELYPAEINKQRFPRLTDWWERCMARPAAKFVYSEGTDEVLPRPKNKTIAGITEFRLPA